MALRNRLKQVTHWQGEVGGRSVLVLGTAHVSRASVMDVEEVEALYAPQLIAVELCAPRYEALNDPDRWRKLDLARVIRERKVWLLLSSLVLSAFQKKIGEVTGSRPGAEMLRAAELADERKATLVLADREIRITLARAWARVGVFSRLWLMSTLLASLLVRDDISSEQIEELKQKDVFEDLLSALPPRYQSLKEVIIDERDRYLASKIRDAAVGAPSGSRLLAVVGAGHVPGIGRTIERGVPVDREALESLPRRFPWRDVIVWATVGLIFVAFGIYAFYGDRERIRELLAFWIVGRLAGAGLGAWFARARPLTILATALLAPISPFFGLVGIRLWMVAAGLELRGRQPRVEDFESIAADTDTFARFRKSLFSNRVLHLFFVIMCVSFGLNIGLFVFMNRFAIDFFQTLRPLFFPG